MPDSARGWRTVALGEVALNSTQVSSNPTAEGFDRYIIGKHIPEDALRVTKWNEVGDAEFGPRIRTTFEPGDVICTTRGPKIKVATVDFSGLCAHTNFVLRTKDSDVLLQPFLEAVIRSDGFQEHLRSNFRGSVNLFVNWSDAAKYELALPPLDEQRRLTRLLNATNDIVEQYDTLARSGTVLRRALEKHFFIEYPEGESLRVGDIAQVRNGTTPKRNEPAYWNGNIAWLTTSKVHDRWITSADEYITAQALVECSLGGVVPAGSTLVAMIGQGITRGKVGLLQISSCISQNFAAVIPGAEVNGEYLFYYLESQYEALRRWSQGTNQQALNCALVRAFPIRVPTLHRQGEIAQLIADADRLYATAVGRVQEAQTLMAKTLSSAVGE